MLRKIKIVSLLIFILAASAFAQQVESFTVNGLKVILKQNNSNDIIAVNLVFKGGTTILEPAQAGIETLALNVALKASENYPKDKLNAALEKMNTQITASSSLDYSSINMLCVKQNFEESWNIFSAAVLNPSFTQEDFDFFKKSDEVQLAYCIENNLKRLPKIEHQDYNSHIKKFGEDFVKLIDLAT